MSRDLTSASRPRCLAVWVGATGLLAGLLVLLPPSLPAGRFDVVLAEVCELALLGCAGWLWLATTVVAVDAARGRTAPRRGVPSCLRRGLLVACGVALTGGLSPAHGVPAPVLPGDENGSAAVVRGLPLPDRATAAGHLVRLLQRATDADDKEDAVVVRPGDTLWDLAEEHLGAGRAWPRLYRANRTTVGVDPDLIHPGQRLVLPPHPREDLS